MNFKKFINSAYLKENPLCGIDTYKDELNLVTGNCTRNIKKLVLTGNETLVIPNTDQPRVPIGINLQQYGAVNNHTLVSCTHFIVNNSSEDTITSENDFTTRLAGSGITEWFFIPKSFFSGEISVSNCRSQFAELLAIQYAAGTPVTVWYVLAEPTTETITVPSGLSGTEEGYLIQDGTPTPTNPIYPTANIVEKWFDTNCYIHKTNTDTITTLPAVLYPTDTTATVGLKGNTVQNGTPTPSNPVEVNGVGERTANLAPNIGWVDGYIDTVGVLVPANAIRLEKSSDFIPIQSGFRIAYSYRGGSFPEGGGQTAWRAIGFYRSDKTFISRPANGVSMTLVAQVPDDAAYIRLSLRTYGQDVSNIMLNTGSTALPYEPYGYKIPISSANTITPVYLGEVETTRKIKKVVLDGTEGLYISTISYRVPIGIYTSTTVNNQLALYSTHFKPDLSSENTESKKYEYTTKISGYHNVIWFFLPLSFFTGEISANNCKAEFASWVAQQYQNGTPVCVWYALATEETGIVNESLMKIGDYVDEVSDITIPTIVGKNTFDVETTLKPSEASISYTGWHDTDIKEYISDTNIGDWESVSITQMENHTIQELQGGNWV